MPLNIKHRGGDLKKLKNLKQLEVHLASLRVRLHRKGLPVKIILGLLAFNIYQLLE